MIKIPDKKIIITNWQMKWNMQGIPFETHFRNPVNEGAYNSVLKVK